jgi:hypothetical protein
MSATSDDAQVNIFKCLDFIRDHAPAYAKAKAERIFLEEFRKSKKALCMKAAETSGTSAIGAQEREAYADPEYVALLDGLRQAVEEEEKLRWMIVAAQAKIEVWRSLEANRRAEAKVL